MSTRRELIVHKYSQTYADVATYLGADARLLPDLDTVDVADLVFFCSVYFCGPEATWPAAVDTLIETNKVVLSPAVRTAVVACVLEFISWFHKLH